MTMMEIFDCKHNASRALGPRGVGYVDMRTAKSRASERVEITRFHGLSTPPTRLSTPWVWNDRQLTLNESVLRVSVLSSNDEGRTRGNGSGPLTIPQPVKHREEVDASMPTRPGSAHPASTSSDQTPPTDPVRLRDCFVDVLAELAGREQDASKLVIAFPKSEED